MRLEQLGLLDLNDRKLRSFLVSSAKGEDHISGPAHNMAARTSRLQRAGAVDKAVCVVTISTGARHEIIVKRFGIEQVTRNIIGTRRVRHRQNF